MRRLTWMTPFALLALVALVACADTGEDTGAAEEQVPSAAEAAGPGEGAPAAAAMASSLACAPTEGPEALAERPSPYDSVSIAVGEGNAKVCYSRPQLRGRTMIGGEDVPYGQLWRFGANEPTIVHLDVAASIAGIELEPGSYSLYTVPMEDEDWTLVVNRSTSQWGHEGSYTPEVEAQEVGRATVRTEAVQEPIESFTIRPDPDGSGLVAEWQNSRVHIPVTAAE